jgi:hypothetical protein
LFFHRCIIAQRSTAKALKNALAVLTPTFSMNAEISKYVDQLGDDDIVFIVIFKLAVEIFDGQGLVL